jgi:hypothetical protein
MVRCVLKVEGGPFVKKLLLFALVLTPAWGDYYYLCTPGVCGSQSPQWEDQGGGAVIGEDPGGLYQIPAVVQFYLGGLQESDLQNLDVSFTVSLFSTSPPGYVSPLTIYGFAGDGVFTTSDFGQWGGPGGTSFDGGTPLVTFPIDPSPQSINPFVPRTYTFDLTPFVIPFSESLVSDGDLWLGLNPVYFGLPAEVYKDSITVTLTPEPSTFGLVICVFICIAGGRAVRLLRIGGMGRARLQNESLRTEEITEIRDVLTEPRNWRS